MRLRVLLISVLLTFSAVDGQNLMERTALGLSCQSTLEPNRIAKKIQPLKSASEYQLFEFDKKNLTKNKEEVPLTIGATALKEIQAKRPLFLSVPIPVSVDKQFILELYQVKMHASGSRIITPTDTIPVSSKNLFYRGILGDDYGSIVTLSIINENVYISINDIHGTYRVVPNKARQKSYNLSVDKSRQEGEFTCGISDEHDLGSTQLYPVSEHPKEKDLQKALSDEIKIYVVCDYKLYQDEGSTISGTEAFVNLLFTEVNALYANEGITMVVSEIFIYNTVDPYVNNGSNTAQTLSDFGSNTPHTFNGDIATLLQGGGLTGGCSLSGYANLNALCNRPPNSNVGPYNVTWGVGDCSINTNATIYALALDVSIVTHEIGHNLGSPHTHNCCWGTNGDQAIDNCVSTTNCGESQYENCGLVPNLPNSDLMTIMSYCGNSTPFSNGFGTLPGNLIRNRVEAATCLSGGGIPNCTNINKTYSQQSIPHGTEIYADNKINILPNVSVGSNSNVLLSAENSVEVNGPFTVSNGANLEIITDECK